MAKAKKEQKGKGSKTGTAPQARTKVEVPLKNKVYCDKKGVYLPADNLRQMLLGNKNRQGAGKILGSYFKAKKGTEYETLIAGCLWVRGLEDPEKLYLQPLRKTWDTVDIRSYVMATGRKVSHRPQMNLPWFLEFKITVYTDALPEGIVRELYNVAGLFCGAGVYGPKFGRFRIVEWDPKTINDGKDGGISEQEIYCKVEGLAPMLHDRYPIEQYIPKSAAQ